MAYYMTIDTETTNSLDDALVYDLGLAIHDEEGNVYHTESFVIADIFFNEELMKVAVFANKIPQYRVDIENGIRTLTTFRKARTEVLKLMKRYNVKAVIAHNAFFDFKSLNTTLRFLTGSKYRFFFPWGTVIWDSLRMAKTTFGKDNTYIEWCKKNRYLTNKYKQPKMTAEILYRYITKNDSFIEEHTGLADVLIEKEITSYFLKRNDKNMKKCLFNPKKEEDEKTMLEWWCESLLCE
jgi:DNA polymerase III epsilon subunit-like protein